jgi:hypothetical protein
MPNQELSYRLWRDGNAWRWQLLRGHDVLASGVAATSASARIAAFRFCQQVHDRKE